MDRTFKTD